MIQSKHFIPPILALNQCWSCYRERLAQFWGGGWFCKTAQHSGWNRNPFSKVKCSQTNQLGLNSVTASCGNWRNTSTLLPAPPSLIPPCKSRTKYIDLCIKVKPPQILELAGNPLPNVGGTQPDYHRWPHHQHRYLSSIGEQHLNNDLLIESFFNRCGIVQMPQSDPLGRPHWLQPLDFFSIRASMLLMESKHVGLVPAVHWVNSLTMVVTPSQQVRLFLYYHCFLFLSSSVLFSLLHIIFNIFFLNLYLSFRLPGKLLRPQNGGIPSLASLPMSNCI